MEGNVDSLDDEELWVFGEAKAKEAFKELCVDPLTKAVGKVSVMEVSSGYQVSSVPIAQVIHSSCSVSSGEIQR